MIYSAYNSICGDSITDVVGTGTPPLHCSKLIIIIIIELLRAAELYQKAKNKKLENFEKGFEKTIDKCA